MKAQINTAKGRLKSASTILFCFCLYSSVIAQEKKISRSEILSNYVFKSNHIRFEASGLTVIRANLKSQSGNYPVKTSFAPGLAIGFKYQFNFNKNYGLLFGPDAILTGRNFMVSFNKNDFSPPLVNDYNIKGINSYLADLILSFPVMIEKRKLYAANKYIFFDGGLRFNVSTGADFDIFSIVLMNTNNAFYDAGGVNVYANNDAKPWLTVPLNAGHAWLLRNNNLLQVSICSNISFTKYVNGTYTINIPGRPLTQGQYSSTGSFVGLSLNYVFTNANYRIRKAYEKMNGIQ
ncbi:MAG: hypothetical protein K2X48_19990 [Chitinophagaceae bacterium]|nr:hypothetical protein [Chitinophagaceae bacterium]